MPCLVPDYRDTPNPKQPKGSVLFIGSSYYNNWYLSRALRQQGWHADLLVCAAEGAEAYLHGFDFYLKQDLPYAAVAHPAACQFLTEVLKRHANAGPEPARPRRWRGFAWRWLSDPRLRRLTNPAYLARAAPEEVLAAFEGYLTTVPEATAHLAPRLWRRLAAPASLSGAKALLACYLRILNPEPAPMLEPLRRVPDFYDILHFTAVNNLRYLHFFRPDIFGSMPIGWDVRLLRRLGKKIVYTNIGCLDGVSQSAFSKWGPEPVCDICRWKNEPTVCSDERNLAWGKLRNELCDYQVTLGGNRADYNADPRVHEVPEFYCLDPQVWRPDLAVPEQMKLSLPADAVKIYHAVGNFALRTHGPEARNIKCTHIYLPLIEQLKREGYKVELIFCHDVPSKDVRFYQAQADIVVDMLTFGFFGANVREALMLGKPAVCFLRPEWLESMRREVPDYVAELPVVNATPDTIHAVLKDLIEHPEKRREIGRRSREFALKWHSAGVGACRLERIYTQLLRQ